MCFKILLFDMWYMACKGAMFIQVKCFIYLFLGRYICEMFLNFLKIILYMILSTENVPENILYKFCILKLPHENGS